MTKTGAVPGQWRSATSSEHTSSNYSLLVVDWCTLDFGSVVSRCCGRCDVAFSPVRIRQTVVSLPWVLPHVPCHTCIPYSRPLRICFVPLVYGLPSGDFRFWANYGLVYAFGNKNVLRVEWDMT